MSAIFISHSSQDNAIAAELGQRLAAQGHRSVFLDFDPQNGIPSGRDWELELYHQLRSCQAVIVLCSEHSMASKWCFAEITHAKSLGKHLIPIRVGACDIESVLTERQVLDLTDVQAKPVVAKLYQRLRWNKLFITTREPPPPAVSREERAARREDAFVRLWNSLKTAGLDPVSAFDWDSSRPPYPGLLAFQEADAPIFFGRDEEIHQGLSVLNRLHQFGGSRMVMVLGASGSGKSSFVRAGLLPRLRLNQDEWLVVSPFRPQERPFQEFAIVLEEAFQEYGKQHSWQEIRDTLEHAAAKEPTPSDALNDLILNLRIAANKRSATVLIVLDQVEELLNAADTVTANRFLRLLKAALNAPSSPFMALCTLRSDFLGDFQQHTEARDLSFEDLRVGPLSIEQLVKIIEGPAEKAALDLETGLSMTMVNDTQTDDALPLLAFTLRELYERYGEDGLLEIDEYRGKLGGLAGSVAKAADAVCIAQPLSEHDEADLRLAFLRMVRITEEGQYARKIARWSDLPDSVHPILERFVQARLLVSHGEGSERILEVAHEALFRSWDRLHEWIQEDQEFLLWRQRLRVAMQEWQRTEHDVDTLLRGAPRVEAERWLHERADDLGVEEQDLIQASIQHYQYEQAEQERKRKQIIRGLLGVILVISVLAGLAELERRQAERQHRIALATQLKTQAELERYQKPHLLPHSVLLATEAMRQFLSLGKYSPDTNQTLQAGLLLLPRPLGQLPQQKGWVTDVAYSPDGTSLVTVSGNSVRVWHVPGGQERVQLLHDDRVRAITYSPDGTSVATASGKAVHIWDVVSGEKVKSLAHKEKVRALAYGPDGTAVVTTDGKAARIWDLASGMEVQNLAHKKKVQAVAYSPHGTTVATASGELVQTWDITSGKATLTFPHDKPVKAVIYDAYGLRIATISDDRAARVWDVGSGQELARVRHATDINEATLAQGLSVTSLGDIRGIAFRPDGLALATASTDLTARVWDVRTAREITRITHTGVVNAVSFSPDGMSLATASTDGTRMWEVSRGGEIARLPHEYSVTGVTFSPDGQQLTTTTSGDQFARVWDVSTGRELRRMTLDGVLMAVTHGPAGQHLASVSGEQVAAIWDVRSGEEVVRLPLEEAITTVTHSPDGQYLAAANATMVSVWQTSDSQQVARFANTNEVTALALNIDGQYVASADEAHIIRVWEVKSGKEVSRMTHEWRVNALTFSPDTKYLATASDDYTARLWEVHSGTQVASLTHEDAVTTVIFNSDGSYVATASEVTARVWEVASGREVARIPHKQGVNALAFSPSDDQYLATASTDNIARVLLWRPKDMVEAACSRLAHNLSPEDWRIHLRDEPYRKTCPQLP